MKKPFYGWAVVFGALLVTGVLWGTLASFGVFLKPMSQDLGLTRAATSAAFSVLWIVCGLFGVIGGWLTDKYGRPRVVVVTGAILGGSGYLLMSQLSASWQLYLFFGVVVAMGQSIYWTPLVATVSRWFTKKRALALGVVLIGLGAGQMTIPPLMANIIARNGWHTAYIAMGALVWLIAIPAGMLLRHSPQDMGLLADGNPGEHNIGMGDKKREAVPLRKWSSGQALRTLPFWLLLTINFIVAAGLQIVMVHIVPYATDVGISATSAALIMTVMGFSNVLARLLSGFVATKIGSRPTLIFCLILQSVTLFGLIEARSLWVFLVLGGLFSFGFSGCSPLTAAMVGEFFGLSAVGAIMGLTGAAWAIGSAIGPYFAGYVSDVTNGYTIAFVIAGIIMTIAVGAAYFLRPVAENEDAAPFLVKQRQ